MERRDVDCLADARPTKRWRPDGVDEVHSGQFMKTNVHDAATGGQACACGEGNADSSDARRCSLPWTASVDGADLSELAERVAARYSSRFMSPRWIDFKGVSLPLHDQVRMNNLLWREWHLRLLPTRTAPLCQFSVAVDDPLYRRPLAVVLEGKYWKRKLDAVTAEYRRCRLFWKERRGGRRRGGEGSRGDSCDGEGLEHVAEASDSSGPQTVSSVAWEASSGDGSSCSRGLDDGSCTQRWAAEQQPASGRLPSAVEQDGDAVTLIEEFLRNEMEWRNDDAALGPATSSSLSFEDAIDILAKVTRRQMEAALPSTSAQCVPELPAHQEREWNVHASSRRLSLHAAPPLLDPSTSTVTVRPPPPPDSRGSSGSDFDVLRRIVPSLGASSKPTKVTILDHSARYCRELGEEHSHLDNQLATLKMQVALLRQQTLDAQDAIPNDEALRDSQRRAAFQAWVDARSSRNCKFCLFALLVAPLFPSFMAAVSVASESDLHRTVASESDLHRTVADWLCKSGSLATIRHAVLSSLTLLCKSTSVLATPDKLPQELLAHAKSTCFLDVITHASL